LDDISEVEFASPVFHFPNTKLILTDEFCVKFDPALSEAEINTFNAQNNVEIIRKSKRKRYLLRVKYPAGMNTLKTANRYYEDPITIYSHPNFMMIIKPTAVTPDDYYFSEQWSLNNTGQTGGQTDADIDAPEGWEICTGSSDIVIAVLDSGVDYNHQDLADNMWINEPELNGIPDYDDDGNGYKDDILGRDCVDEDNDPYPGDNHYMDAHGTACAGLAAAETDNEIGIAGVCWNCKIMPVRVQGADENGDWVTDPDHFEEGIDYAANTGADVLSNSWCYNIYMENIHTAIQDAKKYGREGKGCVLACASGNGNSSIIYPAKYDEVMAVGATDHEDNRHYYYIDPENETGSNYGPELDVVASCGWSG
jgi:subtilisin family serine protease